MKSFLDFLKEDRAKNAHKHANSVKFRLEQNLDTKPYCSCKICTRHRLESPNCECVKYYKRIIH